MQPTYLFLDTEWADVLGAELVSLALVSADGAHRFYAERDPLPDAPTDWVRAVIYPRLERGEVALPDAELTRRLRAFLAALPAPHVLFDFVHDGTLLQYALAGFDLPDAEVALCGPEPTPVLTLMMRDGRMTQLLEGWFAAHPDAAAKRHHALVDAEALRWAWLAVTDRIAPDWMPSPEVQSH